jgi:serine/threonine-protein kinase RsbW
MEQTSLSKRHQFHLEITSEMANLSHVADFVADAARKGKLTQKQSDDVQMAVDEAVTNVMEHAYASRSDGLILIDIHCDAREFLVEIHDTGKSFDVSKLKTPNTKTPLSKREIGGLGVFFMRKLMDKVEFTRDTTGNVTRMSKKLK